jgi:biopolymer transport protein ExbD
MNLARLQPAKPGWMLFAPTFCVLALLLFFFIFGHSFVVQPGIAVVTPPSPFIVAPASGAVVVTIVSGASPQIFFQDRPMSLAEFDLALQNTPDAASRTLIIRADKGTSYDTVLAVANRAIEHHFSVVLASSPPVR